MKNLLPVIALVLLASCAKESDCVKCTVRTVYDGYEPFDASETYCHQSQGYIDSLIDRNSYDIVDTNGKKIGYVAAACE